MRIKTLLKLITTTAILLTGTPPTKSSKIKIGKDGLPEAVVEEDLVLNRENLEETIESNKLLLTFFYDR